MAATQAYRPFPVRNAQIHPGVWVEGADDDVQVLAGNLIDQLTGIERPATLALSFTVRRMSPAFNSCVCPWASIHVPVR
jgi:hypothetical protein